MNHKVFSIVFAALLFSFAMSTVQAQPSQPLNHPEQECFAIAMVGYDSVINSRLGVVPEHALGLAKVKHAAERSEDKYAPFLLKVILDAYLWKDSPHNYAVRTIYRCASEQSQKQLQASLDYENGNYPLMK